MGRGGLALELGVELNRHKPGMVGELHDFDERAVGVCAGDHQAGRLEPLAIPRVELVAVAVSLGDRLATIGRGGPRVLGEHTWLSPEPHRAPLLHHPLLLLHEADHRVGRVAGKLGGVGVGQAGHVAGEIDHGALHAQADPEEGQPSLPGEADRLHLPLDAPLAKASRHEQAVKAGQQPLGPLPFDVFALDRLHADGCFVGNPAVVEGLVDALVGVAMLGIFAHQRDRDLVFRIPQPVEDLVPLLEIGGRGGDPEPPQDDVVKPIALEREGHLVDRKVFVSLLDHGLPRHIAKQRDLLLVGDVERPLGAADEHVGLDADLAEKAHGVLGGLGLEFAGSLEVGHEREVDEHAVFTPHLKRNLPDCLQKREALDIADRAADLGDHDVGGGVAELEHHLLDLVGDVGNHLDGVAEKLPPALLGDHREVNLAGRVVALAGERLRREPLVVAEVEIGLAAVVEDIHLAVLIRAHRAWIDVDVGVELLHLDPQTAGFEQHPDRGTCEPLPQRADHPAGHEHVLRHA